MKTLNRPMFRYGGPIKEGVMNGIREPKKHGGSMGENQGKYLVGDPIYPKTDGRAHHAIFGGAGIAAAALAARAAGPALVRYGRPLLQGAKRIFGKTTPASVTRGSKLTAKQAAAEFGKGSGRTTGVTMNPSKFDPNYLGRDPIVKSIGAIGKGIFSPTSKGLVGKAARFATAPSSIVAGVAYYMWPDGEERKNPPPKKGGVNTPSGNNPFGYEDDVKTTPEGEKELTLAEREALEAKSRMDQMDKYREIIDIKGMSKDAAYKSLIDASKIIQEGGNLKKSLKDGSLISKVTAAASKRFDKVNDTENALRSLVVKGEIENELNKEDKDLKRRTTRAQLALAEKGLSGDSFEEAILKSITGPSGKMPTGNKLAGLLKATRGIDSVVVDGSSMKKPGDEIPFMEAQVKINQEKGAPINPGAYVINSTIIIVDEQGNVKKYY